MVMSDIIAENEEVEGIEDDPEVGDDGDYPLDDLMVRSETRTVAEVIKRIDSERYSMNPDFQRDFIWKKDKQSKLIESCIMRIPLPVFYVAEGEDGRVVVVDGLQRLSTFRTFLSNDLALELGKKHPLEGKKFDDLPTRLQERIEDTQIILYILDSHAPDRARLDIFERVNGGVPLTRQQMRNAIYNGPATRWLADAADSKLFKNVTGGSLRPDTMRDREALNRFCAFQLLGWEAYSGGDMDGFLADALQKMNKMSEKDLIALRDGLNKSLKINRKLFGRHAFRKSLADGHRNVARSLLNISLFEVSAVIFSRISEQSLENDRQVIVDTFRRLVDEHKGHNFYDYISYSTNSTIQVQGRFSLAEAALKEHLQ